MRGGKALITSRASYLPVVSSGENEAAELDLNRSVPRAYIAFRGRGTRLASAWGEGTLSLDALVRAAPAARSALAAAQARNVDTVEICLAHSFRSVDPPAMRRELSNVHRGVRGLALRLNSAHRLHSPTEMLARNLRFDRAIERFLEENGAAFGDLGHGVKVEAFEATQFLLLLDRGPRLVRMHRGNRAVKLREVTRESTEHLAERLKRWLLRNVNADGRMTYKYWPSRGEESTANNMLRQWMATWCLARVAKDKEEVALARRNLEYNLATSYREEGTLGLIVCDGKVKLGAIALATLALLEHPASEEFSSVRAALCQSVQYLSNPDGSFRTFYKPSDRNDNQNFYPGEALLLWATLYERNAEPVLLEQILRSFRHYRTWHARNPNPALVPWHTQAYYKVWRTTRDPELLEFILTRNDWLLSMQQWDSAPYEDVRGQFYDPKRPEFGPPHASSTGVYLEGLADAHSAAKESGNEPRASSYRLAIVRGLRSLMQLQFKDDVDMFYISKRKRIEGGLRTTVYDNTVRVDNVQHSLLAVNKVLSRFGVSDYLPDSRD